MKNILVTGANGQLGNEMRVLSAEYKEYTCFQPIAHALRLAREKVSDEEYAHYTRVIHDESRRLEYIIDRLFEFAKISPAGYVVKLLYRG